MNCKVCGNLASFRARCIGGPFTWWCQSCYGQCHHSDLPHDIEYPIICGHCGTLPATLRVQAKQKKQPQTYWCPVCYERVDHWDGPHDVYDVDSASDESSDEKDEDDLSDSGWFCLIWLSRDAPAQHNRYQCLGLIPLVVVQVGLLFLISLCYQALKTNCNFDW